MIKDAVKAAMEAFGLGMHCYLRGKPEEAIIQWSKAIHLHTEFAEAQFVLAIALGK